VSVEENNFASEL